jgi:hypothetical protein
LPHQPAPGTDARAAGAALSGKSVPIGGVRHEFRDVPRDFRARLCVEFPKATLPRSLSVHRRHLAAGFSNGKDTACPVHIDPSVGLGVSERTKLFSDGDKFWMSDGDKGVGRCGTADGCSCGSGSGCVDRMYFEFAPPTLQVPRATSVLVTRHVGTRGDAAEAVVSADVERDESVGFERLREREQGCGYIAWNLTGPQCLACSSQRIGSPSGLSGGRTG